MNGNKAESKGPFTGRLAEFNDLFIETQEEKKAEEEKIRQGRERRENRQSVFHIEEDPHVSLAELRAEYEKWCEIHSERVNLCYEIPDDDEGQTELKMESEALRGDSNEMRSGYRELIDACASHRLTNRSKLCVLSTAALACGAYTLSGANAPDAITLYGFDRPDAIAGLSDIPDPVIIRPNLTLAEIVRREAAYDNDASAGYDFAQTASPKRLLADVNGHAILHGCGQIIARGRTPILHGHRCRRRR